MRIRRNNYWNFSNSTDDRSFYYQYRQKAQENLRKRGGRRATAKEQIDEAKKSKLNRAIEFITKYFSI